MSLRLSRREFLKAAALGTAVFLGKAGTRGDPSATAAVLTASGERIVKSHCPLCPWACGINILVRDGVIAQVEGMPEDQESRGALCARGNDLKSFVYDPDRIRRPLLRAGDKGEGHFRPISWEEAFGIISERWNAIISESGPESIAGYVGSGGSMERYWLLPRLLSCLGSPNLFTSLVNGQASWAWGGRIVTGAYPCRSMEHLDKTRCFVLWGANPAASAPPFEPPRIFDQQRKGAKLVVIDPRLTPLANVADEWAPITPGTDALLAWSLAQVIITERLLDQGFVEEWTDQFPGYQEIALKTMHSPENVAGFCGIPSEQITRIARLYATNSPAVIVGGRGIDHHSNGLQASAAIHSLVALTGNINRPGGNSYYSYPVEPLRGVPSLEYRLAANPGVAKRLVTLPTGLGDTNRLWDLILADGTDALWRQDVFLTPASRRAPRTYGFQQLYPGSYRGKAYPLRSLLVQGGNPVVSLPDESKGRAALQKLEFLVVADCYVNQTGAYADVILPAAPSPESVGLTGGSFPIGRQYLGLLEQAIAPLGESRSDLDIIRNLGAALGFRREFSFSDTEFVNILLAASPLTSHLNYGKLKASPSRKVPLFQGEDYFPLPYSSERFATRSGKAMLFSANFPGGQDLVPPAGWSPPVEGPDETPALFEKYPLVLADGHIAVRSGSWTRNLTYVGELDQDSWAEMHPTDAKSHQVRDGGKIWIESRAGRALFTVRVTETIRPGVIWIVSRGSSTWGTSWNKLRSLANANTLVDSALNDSRSGSARFKEMLVKVSPEPSVGS